jgi:hypothetical protein
MEQADNTAAHYGRPFTLFTLDASRPSPLDPGLMTQYPHSAYTPPTTQ